MPVDIWYPAASAHDGEDFDPEKMSSFDFLFGPGKNTQNAVMNAKARSGTFPLVVFSHGYGGERRQSTFFYTHLASHGYVIAAMDHVGNTAVELLSGQAAGDAESINRFMQSRPVDASFVIDQMLAGASDLEVDENRIGMSGHSFGGWTTLGFSRSGVHIDGQNTTAQRLADGAEPPPPPRPAKVATLSSAELDALTGSYALAPGVAITVTRKDQSLFAQITGQPAFEVFPESPTKVVWTIVPANATFTLGPDGKATSLTLHQGLVR